MSASPPVEPSPRPSSPCTKVCILDGGAGLCIGCGRTRDEIAVWGKLPEARRLAIMATLEARLREARLEGAARALPRAG